MTTGIKDRVAVVGMGCTKFGEMWDKDALDLAVDACYEAYEDAGVEPKDIQAVWLGHAYEGLTGTRLARALKLDYVPVTHVENLCCSGTDAFRNACYAVASGAYDMVMAVGVEKLKDNGQAGQRSGIDPEVTSRTKMADPAPPSFAYLATRYFHHYGLSYEEGKKILAKIAVKNHHNGMLNPKAMLQKEITVEEAVKAPMIAYPLGLYDCCGISDGAAAAIITTPEIAKKLRKDKDYVSVKALGIVCGAMQGTLQSDYDFVHVEETVRASKMAYEAAGIKDPRREIHMAEVHDCFTITELLIYEDLGFSPRGKGPEDVLKGTFELTGELPVNTDGGLNTFGHPIGASGLRMIYEVYKQLQGKAGPRQLKRIDTGLVHNLGGAPPGSQVVTITILGRP
jgi:acetyl-CoA C-acetyltransferase